ncbi:MAG: FtsX-like permease family protein [Oscillospiraceae bacterium]
MALIAVLFVVSVFIISNTIKLTTFDRKDKIAIMKMVGATNGFIRWPFVYEGLMLGLTGAVLAFFCCNGGFTRPLPRALARVIRCSLFPWCPLHSSISRWRESFWQRGILIGVGGSLRHPPLFAGVRRRR